MGRIAGARCLAWALLVGMALVVCACQKSPYVWASQVPAERAQPNVTAHQLRAGDVLFINVVAQESLSGQQAIGVDGTVTLQDLGAISVLGMTTAQAEEALGKRLRSILSEPRVSITILATAVEVSVLGEVARPGKYLVNAGEGVPAALAMAGGLTEFGNKNALYLVRASEPKRIRFRLRDLVSGGDSATRFVLQDGDLLVIE